MGKTHEVMNAIQAPEGGADGPVYHQKQAETIGYNRGPIDYQTGCFLL